MNNKKQIRAWTFYDWANSAYSLVITSAIFPIYYAAVLPEQVQLFGANFKRGDVAAYAISLSFLIIAFLSPMLSGIADSRGNKKNFLKFFCYLGSLSCVALFFFTEQTGIYYGLGFSVLASVGFCGSLVFYNAYLPEIVSKENQDKISARGFAMGYIGSVLLLLLCLVCLLKYDTSAYPARLSFVAVGIWWLGFAQITFRGLPDVQKVASNVALGDGFKSLKKVWQQLNNLPQLKRFLIAFFFYNMGVQTVMYMATYFGTDELKMETAELITTILIIQLVAIGGAYLSAAISKRIGNVATIIGLVMIWIGICVGAYFVQTVTAFYALAFVVGLVMGGIQSLSRSTYSKMLPHSNALVEKLSFETEEKETVINDTASYFSFYDVCEKVGIVFGTMTFGLVSQWMGGMRQSTLALMVYFVVGLVILLTLLNKEENSSRLRSN
jgi:MFS transporter, UMF1 family